MFTQEECYKFNSQLKGTMMEALSIKFLPSDDNVAMAEMPICEASKQYFGILHGGASLALAESLAGAASLHTIHHDENARICGLQVTGNHVSMSATEGKVIAKATGIHIGKTTHIWNVDIFGEDGKLISTERVTNMVIYHKS